MERGILGEKERTRGQERDSGRAARSKTDENGRDKQTNEESEKGERKSSKEEIKRKF